MKTICKSLLIFAVTATLTASLAMAQSSKNKPVDVTLTAVTVMPDGAQLQPGDYRMTLLNDSATPQVEFYQKGKLVCKCPVKIENTPAKSPQTQMLYNVKPDGTRVLQSVRVRGWTQALIFSSPAAPGAEL